MKIILASYILLAAANTMLLVISDAGWVALGIIIPSLFSLIGLFLTLWVKNKVNSVDTKVAVMDKKVDAVAVEVDGKLEKMVALTRDKFHAEGFKEATDAADKEKAVSNETELKILKEQQLRDQVPTNSGIKRDDMKNVKDDIVQTLESEIHKKGEEMKKVVEDKADDIQDEVKVVPEKVVDKLKPK